MDSLEQYTYKDPINSAPIIGPINDEGGQSQSYDVQGTNYSSPVTFQGAETYGEYDITNTYNQSNDTNNYTENININTDQAYEYGNQNQTNYVDTTNQIDLTNTGNQYDFTNLNLNENNQYGNDLNSYNQYDYTNTANFEGETNTYTPMEETNQISSYTQDFPNNVTYQTNEINTENQTVLANQAVPIEENIINQVSTEKPSVPYEFTQAYDVSGANKINEVYEGGSFNINVLNNVNTVSSFNIPQLNISTNSPNNKTETEKKSQNQKKIDSPRLINPLASPVPPSPPSPVLISRKLPSNQNDEENRMKLQSKIHMVNPIVKAKKEIEDYKLKLLNKIPSPNISIPDKKLSLNIENPFKNFKIKTHFDLSLMKEMLGFEYRQVHKVGIPLLSHFEMPQNCEYKSPLLSPNGQYLACIAKGDEDYIYVWEVKNLYWYKYKFSASQVDGIAFTPESKALILVYKSSNPIMYDLSTGKPMLEFESIGEEITKDGGNCTFSTSGSHFIYTNEKSFTLWSLNSGVIKQQILDNSPIKIVNNEYLICIDNELNTVIKRISTNEELMTFKLKGADSVKDILDARCSLDMTNFVYVIKKGIIRYNFQLNDFKGVQKFDFCVEKAKISEDCKFVLKTNMKNISVFDLENEKIVCTILKEKFKEISVDFKNKKIVVIDDMCIDIQNIDDDGAIEKYVWLDKNPTKFESVKFSRDFKVLLARVNRNNAIVYDLKTGYAIKKWQNIDENWLDFAMTRYGGDKIATKSNMLLVRVWNFSTGREEASFYGYDSYSFCFSGGGLYLACGTKFGNEIARIWDIPNQKYGIFRHDGTNNNFHTVVHLTNPEPEKLICCAVDQQPLVFNTHTRKLLFSCDCPYRFEEIYNIQSDLRYNVFLVKGRDERKRNVGILYKLSDGSLLEIYENYSILELAKNAGALIVKCENINGGKLTSTNIKNLGDPQLNDFQVQSDRCQLLEDNKCAVIEFGDEYNKEFNFVNVVNGAFIGKINFTKNSSRKSATYITVDPINKEMFIRYFELLSPQETMSYKNKNITTVENN